MSDPVAVLKEVRELIAVRDRLQARINWASEADVAEFNVAQDKLAARVPSLVAAVEAVLGLHAGEVSEYGGHGFKEGDLACKSCGVDDGWWGVPWPCPTVQAAGAALGSEGNRGG